MSEPTVGYNGRSFKILIDNVVIAAVQSREAKFTRSDVDVTTDDSDGYRRLLSEPGEQSVDVSVKGVATIDNYDALLERWQGRSFTNAALQHPNGTVTTASDGFMLGNLSFSGEHKGHVAFSADLKSSGVVTNIPPSS